MVFGASLAQVLRQGRNGIVVVILVVVAATVARAIITTTLRTVIRTQEVLYQSPEQLAEQEEDCLQSQWAERLEFRTSSLQTEPRALRLL